MVLAIVAAVVTLGINRIDNRNNEMKAAIRKLSVLSKELKTASKLQGATYRLAIDLGRSADGSKQDYVQKFWVEKSTQQILVPKDAESLAVEEAKRTEEEKKEKPNPFERDDKILGGEKTLPGKLEFEDVEVKRLGQPVTHGVVYIHYFAQGLCEEAAIHIKAGDMHWTLLINPLTGKATVNPSNVKLSEVQNQ